MTTENILQQIDIPELAAPVYDVNAVSIGKPVYLNLRTSHGVETVDEFSRESGQSHKDFRKYVSDMVREYRIAGMSVYKSSRCTKDWKNQ